jgi:hypothetical protein
MAIADFQEAVKKFREVHPASGMPGKTPPPPPPAEEWDPSMPSRGLGDTIAKVTHATGIDKLAKVYTKVTKKPCGCHGKNGRQGKLNRLVPYKSPKLETIPIRGAGNPTIWQGRIACKPWKYQITAAIPCLDHAEETAVCIELLRLQTVRPYIILVDTGSLPDQAAKLEALRADDVEVHRLRLNSTRHPSDPVAYALDLCQSICDTPYLFTTHQDCFLRRRDFLEYLVCEIDGYAVVGYRLTERKHPDWQKMFGHTATLFDMAVMDDLGVTWTLRRAARLTGMEGRPEGWKGVLNNWPDTESTMNTILMRAGVNTKFVGTEQNYVRNKDENIDHCRSMVCSSLYWRHYYQAKAVVWMREAIAEARSRVLEWTQRSLTDTQKVVDDT